MSPTRMSRVEAAIRVVLAFHEARNRQDAGAMQALIGDDCVFEHYKPAPDGALYEGQQAIVGFWQQVFTQSPVPQIIIEEIFSLGRRCIMRWQSETVDAEGMKSAIRGVDLFQVSDGLIVEILSYAKG